MRPAPATHLLATLLGAAALLATPPRTAAAETWMLVSVPEQSLTLFDDGTPVRTYAVSTSRYGLGDRRGSYRTPAGLLAVADKVGAGAPQGAVFKNRHRTGEVLPPNAKGRDPIVTRILHLKGLQPGNQNAYSRGIYIHGTPQEAAIGRRASYGCIRMRSCDVADLFDRVGVGARVLIVNQRSQTAVRLLAKRQSAAARAAGRT